MAIVEVKDLWKYPAGCSVFVDKKRYVYLGRTDYDGTMEFYDFSISNIVSEEEIGLPDSVRVDVSVLDLKTLIDAQLAMVMTLVDDGWTRGGEMDITDAIDKLEIYKKLDRIVNG